MTNIFMSRDACSNSNMFCCFLILGALLIPSLSMAQTGTWDDDLLRIRDESYQRLAIPQDFGGNVDRTMENRLKEIESETKKDIDAFWGGFSRPSTGDVYNQAKIKTEEMNKRAIEGESNYKAGYVYEYGVLAEQDFKKAADFYKKASALGHSEAQNTLGNMYFKGRGVEKNVQEALRLLNEAAKQGHAEALNSLAYLYSGESGEPGIEKKPSVAFLYTCLAAGRGSGRAQYNLGMKYYLGEECEKNYEKAFEVWHMSAEQGVAEAQNNLGWLYHQGLGTKRNLVEARKWYLSAIEKGIDDAKVNLENLNAGK